MLIGMYESIVYIVFHSVLKVLFFSLLCSLLLIVIQTNPVYAVFSFIITALLVFSFLILVGAEFFAILILIIYTGVITVLFLFVVIMYNFRVIEFNNPRILALAPLSIVFLYKIFWVNNICKQNLMPVLKQQIQMHTSFFTIDVDQVSTLFNEHYFLF